MSVLPIYLYGSDALRAKARPVKELDDSIVRLVYDMFETMRNAGGIGLAATQVGDLHRVVVIDISEVEELKEEDSERVVPVTSPDLPRRLVLINPEIVSEEGSSIMEEGCLSIPEARSEVERPEKALIQFRDANFQETELHVDGLLARVMLHEIDHLDGVLFLDRISPSSRTLLRPKLRKIKRGEVETAYPVVAAPARQTRSGGPARRRPAYRTGKSGGVEV